MIEVTSMVEDSSTTLHRLPWCTVRRIHLLLLFLSCAPLMIDDDTVDAVSSRASSPLLLSQSRTDNVRVFSQGDGGGRMLAYRDGRELKEGQTILVIGLNGPRTDQT
jgi:hypothetical protein